MESTCNLRERIRREDYGLQVKGRSFSSRHRTRGKLLDCELSLRVTTAAMRVPRMTGRRHIDICRVKGTTPSHPGIRRFTSLSVSKLTSLPSLTACRDPRHPRLVFNIHIYNLHPAFSPPASVSPILAGFRSLQSVVGHDLFL